MHILDEEAEELKKAQERVKLNPNDAMAYLNRGDCFFDLDKFENALADYKKIVELDPSFSDVAEKVQILTDIKNYSEEIKTDPNDEWLYNKRGLAYHRLQKFRKAIEDFRTAVKINPKFTEAYLNRGKACSDYYEELNWGHTELYDYFPENGPLEDFEKVIELDPNCVEAYYLRGCSYMDLENYPQAIKDFAEVLKITPDSAKAYQQLGYCHKALSEKFFIKAAKLGYKE